MTTTLKIGDMELCEDCISGKTYKYDLNKRCCRARHMLNQSKPLRQKRYEYVAVNEGKHKAEELISDVKAMYAYKQAAEAKA